MNKGQENIEVLQREKQINSHLEKIYVAHSEYIQVLEKYKKETEERLRKEEERNLVLESDLKEAQDKIMSHLAHRRAAQMVRQEREWNKRQKRQADLNMDRVKFLYPVGGHKMYSANQIVADSANERMEGGEQSPDSDLDTVDKPREDILEMYRKLPDTDDEG